jgi:hypothetical protein
MLEGEQEVDWEWMLYLYLWGWIENWWGWWCLPTFSNEMFGFLFSSFQEKIKTLKPKI